MNDNKKQLLGMSTGELVELVQSLGQPKFRGKQLGRWLYEKNAASVTEMSDLPAAFRDRLMETAEIRRSNVVGISKSTDGTAKYLLELFDGQRIEAVLLPYEDRVSVCISTQVGCGAECAFCATGLGGFCRNLDPGEIVDEVLTLQKNSSRRITHVVYMGMGEPLFNYENVLKSICLLTSEVGIGMRHMTISTVGVTPRIRELAQEHLQLNLAVSLHAPNDDLRQRLIPISTRFPMKDLMAACRDYADTTHRRVTFEYLLINGVNDSVPLAKELVSLLRGMMCSVNLIPYNEVEGLEFRRPSRAAVKAFRAVLEEGGIVVTQRMERGRSIEAACGQLRRRSLKD